REPHVVQLRRALHGLRQSPNVWNSTIDTELRTRGFLATASDPFAYTKGCHGRYTIPTLVMNEMLMTGPSTKPLHAQDTLKPRFSISELGPAYLIVRMEVIRDEARGTLKLSQHKYVNFLLRRLDMDSCNPVHTPGAPRQLVDDATEYTVPSGTIRTDKLSGYGWRLHLSGPEHKIRHCL
ncbi:unnamed protein product, partial [Sphacelaria rigidula]